MRDADYVKSLKIGWDSLGVSSVSLITLQGTVAIFGTKQSTSSSFNFKESTQFVGFYGRFSSISIGQLGVIVYKPSCGLMAQESYEASLADDEE